MDCSICNEDFNEKVHRPISLNPCGHSFCLKCINQLPNQVCPNCRIDIQSKTVNYGIMNMLKDIARSKSSMIPARHNETFHLNGTVFSKLEQPKQIPTNAYEERNLRFRTTKQDLEQRIMNLNTLKTMGRGSLKENLKVANEYSQLSSRRQRKTRQMTSKRSRVKEMLLIVAFVGFVLAIINFYFHQICFQVTNDFLDEMKKLF